MIVELKNEICQFQIVCACFFYKIEILFDKV